MAQPPGAAAVNPATTSSNTSTSSSASSKDLPRDARIIALLLGSMGVPDAEPAVVAMLLEFAHRYTSEVLSSALNYAEHAARPRDTAAANNAASSSSSSAANNLPTLELDDLRLAVSSKQEHSYSSPYPKEFLLPLASQINRIPLPILPESYGIRLPPERERMTAVNWDYKPVKERRVYPDLEQRQREQQQAEHQLALDGLQQSTSANGGMDIDFAKATNDLFGGMDDEDDGDEQDAEQEEDDDDDEDDDDEDMEEVTEANMPGRDQRQQEQQAGNDSTNGDAEGDEEDDDGDAEGDADADAGSRGDEDDDYDA